MGKFWKGVWGGIRTGLNPFMGLIEATYKKFKMHDVYTTARSEGATLEQARQEMFSYEDSYKPMTVGYRGWNDSKHRGNATGFGTGVAVGLLASIPFAGIASLAAGIKSIYNVATREKGRPIGSYQFLGEAEQELDQINAQNYYPERTYSQSEQLGEPSIEQIVQQPVQTASQGQTNLEATVEDNFDTELEGYLAEQNMTVCRTKDDMEKLDFSEPYVVMPYKTIEERLTGYLKAIYERRQNSPQTA